MCRSSYEHTPIVGTLPVKRGRHTLSLEKVTSLPIQDGRIALNEWPGDRLLKATRGTTL